MKSYLQNDKYFKILKTSLLFILPIVSILSHKLIPLFLLAMSLTNFKTFPVFFKKETFLPPLSSSSSLSKETRLMEWLIFLYASASVVWSEDPVDSCLKLLQMGGMCLLGAHLVRSRPSYERMGKMCFLYGWGAGALLLGMELLSQGWLYRKLHHVPGFLSMSVFNKGVTVLALLFWPWLGIFLRGRSFIWHGGAIFLFTLFCLLSHSETTVVAMSVSLIAFMVGAAFPTLISSLIGLGVLFSSIFVLFLPTLLPSMGGMALLSSLPTLAHRFLIWDFFVGLIHEKRWFGWGLDAAHFFSHDQIYVKEYQVSAFHTHNIPLQIWLELGGVGILLFLGLIYKILKWIEGIKDITPLERNLLFSQFVMIFMISNAAFGAWQTWWIASLWITVFCNKIFLHHAKK